MKLLACVLLGLLAALCEGRSRPVETLEPLDVGGRLVNIAPLEDTVSVLRRSLLREHGGRWKRSAARGFGCMQGCLASFTARTAHFTDSASALGLLNRRLYQPKGFEEYCDSSLDARECFQGCLDSELSESPMAQTLARRVFASAFRAVEFICEERREDFEDALPCFAATADDAAEACDGKCGDPEKLARQAKQEVRLAAVAGDFPRIGKLLEEQCRYIRCTLKCESRVMMRQCEDHEPALLLNNFVSVTIRSLQDIMASVPGGAKFWPPTCRRLAQHDERIHSGEDQH